MGNRHLHHCMTPLMKLTWKQEATSKSDTWVCLPWVRADKRDRAWSSFTVCGCRSDGISRPLKWDSFTFTTSKLIFLPLLIKAMGSRYRLFMLMDYLRRKLFVIFKWRSLMHWGAFYWITTAGCWDTWLLAPWLTASKLCPDVLFKVTAIINIVQTACVHVLSLTTHPFERVDGWILTRSTVQAW